MKFIILFLISFIACAHPGGQIKTGDWEGCHNDNTKNNFHCHTKSRFNGQSWKNKTEAEKWLAQNRGKEVTPTKREIRYNRRDWGYPKKFKGGCKDTRALVLEQRSTIPVVFKPNGCTITTGRWVDFYTDEIHTEASKVEIDHLVSIYEAYESGGKDWTKKRKSEFANDFENLVVTSKEHNRKKGRLSLGDYIPTTRERACRYQDKYISIKNKYKLVISDKERNAVIKGACD
jgi:hypothetical protein